MPRLLLSAVLPVLILALAVALALTVAAEPDPEKLRVTHGVVVGDVGARSAVVWARSSAPAEMEVLLASGGDFSSPLRRVARSTAARDQTAQVSVDGLEPATHYVVRVTFRRGDSVSPIAEARFTTAPARDVVAPVRLVVGGDVGGQGFCRDAADGYAIFRAMAGLEPDFFIANGDMIYADGACPEDGPGEWRNVPGNFPSIDDPAVDWSDGDAVREVLNAHWRYNRIDPHVVEFHSRVPMYAQWDDHEVVNDFGAPWQSLPKQAKRRGFPTLVAEGRAAFFAWNPIAAPAEEPERIYRSFRWGRDAELFLLDARSYRDRNDVPERPEASKTILGKAQREWLIDAVAASDATWKIVSSDVPLSVPTGSEASLYGHDSFANGDRWDVDDFAERTGFEDELLDILGAWDAANVRNIVFVVTDVHFAMSLRYTVDLDGDGDALLFHELLNGPLNAVRVTVPPGLDPTLGPAILYGEGNLFNFSLLEILRRPDGTPILRADIRDASGEPRFGSKLELVAEPPGSVASDDFDGSLPGGNGL